MRNPIGQIFEIFGLKKTQTINIFAKTFAYIKNEYYRKNGCETKPPILE